MARILLDTADVGHTAGSLVQVQREMSVVLARVGVDAAVVMPPAVAADVAGAVRDVTAGVGRTSVRYVATAADLQRRRLLAEAADGSLLPRGPGGIPGRPGGPLGPVGPLGPGVLPGGGWPFPGRGPMGFPFPFPGAGGPLVPRLPPGLAPGLGKVLRTGQEIWGNPYVVGARGVRDAIDTGGFLVDNVRTAHLGSPRLDGAVIRTVHNTPWHVAGNTLAVVSGLDNALTAWDASRGENWAGRITTVTASVGSDVLLTKVPVVAAADVVSGGAVRADLAAFGDMYGGAVSEGSRRVGAAIQADLARHDYTAIPAHAVGAAVSGAAHGANEGLNRWADDASAGKHGGFIKAMSDVENKAIDAAYPAVSDALGAVGAKASSAVNGVKGVLGGLF